MSTHELVTSILFVGGNTDSYHLIEDLLFCELQEAKYSLYRYNREVLPTSLLCSWHYDVALFEYKLGKDDYPDLIRQARQRNPCIGLIVLTDRKLPDLPIEMLESDVDGFLSKNCLTRNMLLNAIAQVISVPSTCSY